ncbi:MAG: hypothetical protein DWQ37_04645 [Planctomycetota bacterium]|nr:MAG: hypothetical protein DWQ37_04645 [Planctomycetota bacterium]
MQRGTIAILMILVVAVTAGVVAVVYRVQNQQQAQAFWGNETALLIDRAPNVEVLEIGEARSGIVLDSEDELSQPPPEGNDGKKESEVEEEEKEPLPQAVEFNQVPWIIARSLDGSQAKGVTNLRRALVEDSSFDWTVPEEAKEPVWQYGLAIDDGRNFATVLFDLESRQVGLAGGNETTRLRPEMNEDFREFFAEQLSAPAGETEDETNEADESPADAAQANES